MTTSRYGFVGLGNMGGPMSLNMTKAGFELMVYDKAGTEQRSPAGSIVASSLAELARGVETVFLSVPDGNASLAIAQDILALNDSIIGTVIDLSTTGVEASRRVHQTLAASDIAYIDSPVSGGKIRRSSSHDHLDMGRLRKTHGNAPSDPGSNLQEHLSRGRSAGSGASIEVTQ